MDYLRGLLYQPSPFGQPSLHDLISQQSGGYGLRTDGTQKGNGWLGALATGNGNTMTEYSAESEHNGKPMLYPLITPNQSFTNLSQMLNTGQVSEEAHRAAYAHAIARALQGMTMFAPEQLYRQDK